MSKYEEWLLDKEAERVNNSKGESKEEKKLEIIAQENKPILLSQLKAEI